MADEIVLPDINLTKSVLLYEKQPSGLYIPRWQGCIGDAANNWIKGKDNEPISWAGGSTVTITAANMITDLDLTSFGLPFLLSAVKSGAVNSCTLTYGVSGRGFFFNYSGTTDTLKVSIKNKNGTDLGDADVKYNASGTETLLKASSLPVNSARLYHLWLE